jgi:hypothetical protein
MSNSIVTAVVRGYDSHSLIDIDPLARTADNPPCEAARQSALLRRFRTFYRAGSGEPGEDHLDGIYRRAQCGVDKVARRIRPKVYG